MEIFFLDVGQGTCQVIMLGQRRAIVIDCGLKNDQPVLQFLRRSGVEYLERLIVSHSHNDHIGGAVSIMGAYQDRVGKYCFVQDHLFLESAFWNRLKDLYATARITRDQMVRLEVEEKPQVVWKDESKSIRLQTLSPSAAENLMAQDGEKPNATSAVLFLQSGVHRVIFAADSEVPQWKEIHRSSGRKLHCDVLAVPHHAGKMHSSRRDLKWLYEDVLSASTAVVSAGTSNTHGHPRSDVIEAMTASGLHVLCTQITRRCNGNARDLEHLRPGVLRPQIHLGRSSATTDLTAARHSRNVACAGTVRVEITSAGLMVERLTEHRRAVDRLPRNVTACPLCRVAASSS